MVPLLQYNLLVGREHAWIVAAFTRLLQKETGWPPIQTDYSHLLHCCEQELIPENGYVFCVAWEIDTTEEIPPDDPDREDTGEPIGLLGMHFSYASLLGPYLDIQRFYVRDGWRHRGIGRGLIEYACSILPDDLDIPVLCTDLSKAKKLPMRGSYRRMGFTPISTVSTIPLPKLKSYFGRTHHANQD